MKYAKTYSALFLAVIASLVCSGQALATVVTSGGVEYTGTISAESEGPVSLHGAFATVSCRSKISAKVESHGSGQTTKGNIATLHFYECNFPVQVEFLGSLEAHSVFHLNGTLTSSGTQVTIKTSIVSCIFKTSFTHVGTLTGSTNTGGRATFDIDSAAIPRTGHSIFCGSSGEWTGTYVVTSPSNLNID